MKIAHYLLAGLFLLFAVVQYKDPDPWLWIGIYVVVAALSVAGWYARTFWAVGVVLTGLLIYAAFYVPDLLSWINGGMPSIASEMKTDQPHIELVREFFGLLISIAALGFLFWHQWRKRAAR